LDTEKFQKNLAEYNAADADLTKLQDAYQKRIEAEEVARRQEELAGEARDKADTVLKERYRMIELQ
jgi:hypothetical protein